MLKNNVNKCRIGEGVYLLYFALMVGARALGLYEGMLVYNVSLVIGLLLFAFKIVVTEHTFKEYAIIAMFLLLAGVVYIHTGEKGLLVCFTMMLGMKNVAPRKVIETGALTAGVIVLTKIFLGVFGFTSEIYYPQERAGVGVMFRHALGYAHPNTLHMNVLMLSMMIMYLVTITHNEKKKYDHIIVVSSSLLIFLFNLYIFQYSGSRTGLLACIAYLFVNLWFYARKTIGILEKIVSYAAFPIVCFIAIILPLVVSDDLFELLNSTIFNSRFSLAKYFWSNNSISLWGIRLVNPDESLRTYGIDMAQLYLFLQLGIIAFLFMAVLTIWFIYECIKNDRRAELAVMLGMLFLGMWEPLLYNLGFKNFVYVFMGGMLYGVLNADFRAFEDHGSLIPKSIVKKLQCGGAVSAKTAFSMATIAVFIGLIVSMCYLLSTPQPSALYGDRQENEAGFTFHMKPLYISQEEIDSYEAGGDIVIGYVDDKTPMYKYDEIIADMEYDKKVLSVGVWSSMFSAVIMFAALWYNGSRLSKKKGDKDVRKS